VSPTDPSRWVAPVPGTDGYWFEIAEPTGDPEHAGAVLGPLLADLVSAEGDTLHLAKLLAARYEEIELLYTISEILGRTIGLEQAAQTILEAVSSVVGATRASILVYDESAEVLRPVASLGRDVSRFGPLRVDSETIAVRVFREGRIISYDPRDPNSSPPKSESGRAYRGSAFLSVPILYPQPDGPPRPIGVINLTDRIGTDAFSGGERRLVAAIASQIGAAIENARLVARDVARKRLQHELELAHDLQMKLLPSPDHLGPGVDVAAICRPAETVGGDFYSFVRLSGGRVGVMLGDVSSHGFSAALVMALVLSAAAIHAAEEASPDDTVRRLLESVEADLAETEMHLSLFYGVVDPQHRSLHYANAGHPHAFRITGSGETVRLTATSPPLGLSGPETIAAESSEWVPGEDVLFLVSDGITDAQDASGERFGEQRGLELAIQHRTQSSQAVVDAVIAAAAEFDSGRRDDRTILVLRS
jgi:sigma-B regulation protein RsbU (phosphoserine phosphatase)